MIHTGGPGGRNGSAIVTSPTANMAPEIHRAAVPVRSTRGDHRALKVQGMAKRLMRPSSVSEALCASRSQTWTRSWKMPAGMPSAT